MRRLLRLMLAAAVFAGLIAFLRRLFEEPAGVPGTAGAPDRPGQGASEGNGTAEPSRAQLYERAKRLDIEGRSKMNKSELQRAIASAEGSGS